MAQWLTAAGLNVVMQRNLPPEPGSEGKIAVALWLARDPRVEVAGTTVRVVKR